MTTAAAATALRDFFATVDRASLELPDGWFGGRQGETLLALTGLDVRTDGLSLELDGLHHLELSGSPTVAADGHDLVIAGFDVAAFRPHSYSDGSPLQPRTFRDGVLHFAA